MFVDLFPPQVILDYLIHGLSFRVLVVYEPPRVLNFFIPRSRLWAQAVPLKSDPARLSCQQDSLLVDTHHAERVY